MRMLDDATNGRILNAVYFARQRLARVEEAVGRSNCEAHVSEWIADVKAKLDEVQRNVEGE